MEYEERLKRFEDKLDAINESLITLARIEERVTTILKNNDKLHSQINALDTRVDDLESNSAVQTFTLDKGERLFWIAVTVVAGLLASGVVV